MADTKRFPLQALESLQIEWVDSAFRADPTIPVCASSHIAVVFRYQGVNSADFFELFPFFGDH